MTMLLNENHVILYKIIRLDDLKNKKEEIISEKMN